MSYRLPRLAGANNENFRCGDHAEQAEHFERKNPDQVLHDTRIFPAVKACSVVGRIVLSKFYCPPIGTREHGRNQVVRTLRSQSLLLRPQEAARMRTGGAERTASNKVTIISSAICTLIIIDIC